MGRSGVATQEERFDAEYASLSRADRARIEKCAMIHAFDTGLDHDQLLAKQSIGLKTGARSGRLT